MMCVQVEMTDFAGSPELARQNINGWVEKLTKGNIKDLGTEKELIFTTLFSRIPNIGPLQHD
jgi:serine protease inhibitor